MAILLTGAAGFIGYHTALRLLDRGEEVIGVDNLNDYYDPRLKEARLAQLRKRNNFSFHRADIADRAAMGAIAAAAPDIDQIVHLAAQAGVRYSLINPQAYVDSNVTGHLVMLELARKLNRARGISSMPARRRSMAPTRSCRSRPTIPSTSRSRSTPRPSARAS